MLPGTFKLVVSLLYVFPRDDPIAFTISKDCLLQRFQLASVKINSHLAYRGVPLILGFLWVRSFLSLFGFSLQYVDTYRRPWPEYVKKA